MTVTAFVGPSLPASAREQFPGVEWRPPAEAGDLLRLEAGPGLTVCLIDGYFDHRPAVRHKEILLLLSEKVPILGASSIGALRAAEMDRLGMIGIGSIYRAYARGTLTGDDEVALVHASADKDWRPLSLPLVDVRATLGRARREGILTGATARALLNAARTIHYVDRSWPEVLAAVQESKELSAFVGWLPDGKVDQKRKDAEACLCAAVLGEPRVGTAPEMIRTRFFDDLAGECGIDLDARCGGATRRDIAEIKGTA